MSATYTLLEVIQRVGREADSFDSGLKSLSEPDAAINTMVDIVNQIIVMMAREKGVPWAMGHTIVEVPGAEADASVSLTSGSKTVSSITWSKYASHPYGTFMVTNSSDKGYRVPFRFIAASSSTLTLSVAWPFDSDTVEAIVYADHFLMPDDFDSIISASFRGSPVTGSSPLIVKPGKDLLKQRFVMRDYLDEKTGSVAYPQYISVVGRTDIGPDVDPAGRTDSRWMAMIDPPLEASQKGSIEIFYKKTYEHISSAATVVPVDDKDIDILVDGVLAKWNSTLNRDEQVMSAWTKNRLEPWAGKYRPSDEPQVVDKLSLGAGGM
jgi:hypothetical protein